MAEIADIQTGNLSTYCEYFAEFECAGPNEFHAYFDGTETMADPQLIIRVFLQNTKAQPVHSERQFTDKHCTTRDDTISPEDYTYISIIKTEATVKPNKTLSAANKPPLCPAHLCRRSADSQAETKARYDNINESINNKMMLEPLLLLLL